MSRTHALILLLALLGACGSGDPIAPERYIETDALAGLMRENLASAEHLVEVADIDHSRLGQDAGSPMAPARVLIFSDPQLEAQLIKLNPLAALELPMRILTFEQRSDGSARVVYNSFDYLASRYQLRPEHTDTLQQSYESNLATVLRGVPDVAITSFPVDDMQPDGIVTLQSPYAFTETLERVNAAIDAQDDAMRFGMVDFQADARAVGVEIPPSQMILFGAPGPGGKAMADAATLGLDGFCQKFLVWQDNNGNAYLSFNDLLELAERQNVSKSLALRVIDFRLNKTFSDALSLD